MRGVHDCFDVLGDSGSLLGGGIGYAEAASEVLDG
jgi:hypothetical protein